MATKPPCCPRTTEITYRAIDEEVAEKSTKIHPVTTSDEARTRFMPI